MKTEDIIRMAREAGWPDSLVAPIIMAKLAEFAALVAAAEREACAKVCDDLPMYGPDDETANWYGLAQVDCAAAIRARGNK